MFFFFDGDNYDTDSDGYINISDMEVGIRTVYTVNHSLSFQKLIRDNIPEKSNCINASYTIKDLTLSPYLNGNIYDTSLKYSLGDVKISLQYTYYEVNGVTIWDIEYVIRDSYTFEKWEKRKGNSDFTKLINNTGLILQSNNLISTYYWKCSGSYTLFPRNFGGGGRSVSIFQTMAIN